MGWLYFNIAFLGTVANVLLKIEHENAATKCAVFPSISNANAMYYSAVTNEWLTLDKSDCFKVCCNLNIDIK